MGSYPPRVRVLSYNLWLIPFGGPWCLGRAALLARRLCHAAEQMRGGGGAAAHYGDVLTLVALQEAWAWRAGPLLPLVRAEAALQAWLLQRAGLRSDREPWPLRALFGVARAKQPVVQLVESAACPA